MSAMLFSRIFPAFLFFWLGVCGVGFSNEVLTWEDCLKEAAIHHPDLIAAREEIVQGQTAKIIAASDGLPQVTANVSGTASRSDSSGGGKTFDYGASGTQLIFDGLKTINNVRAASETITAAKENFKFTSAEVRLRLRAAFVNLLKAQELVSLTETIYKIRKDNLDLITLRYQSGTEHKGALLTARANVAQAEFEIHQARRDVEAAQRQLLKELGLMEFLPILVKGSFDASEPVAPPPEFEKLAGAHPSILKIDAEKNAAAFDVKADQGDLWPEISVTGDISKSDNSWPPDEKGSSAGFRVSLPLFEGGARLARVAQSKSIYRQLTEQERSLRDGIVLALEQAWNDWQDAVETVKVQNDFLNASEERAKIAEEQYSVGLISFDNWTIIEDDLVRNKKTFLNTQANALLAEAQWIQAKGETLEYENK